MVMLSHRVKMFTVMLYFPWNRLQLV